MKSKLSPLSLLIVIMLMFLPDSDLMAQGKSKKGPPDWAPAHGYRAQTRQVYFADYNVYYDLEKSVYISYSNGDWHVEASLPLNLKGINLQAAVQVELNLDTDSPQQYNAEHKQKYKDKSKKDKSGKVKTKKK